MQGTGDEGSGQTRRGVWIFCVCVTRFLTCEILVFYPGIRIVPPAVVAHPLNHGLQESL